MTLPQATTDRLARILLVVPWLLEHPGATIDEVCDRVGTDREGLLGDLDLLGYTGLPGYGGGDLVDVRISGDRVSIHLADFFARPLALTVEEGAGLWLAGHALESLGGVRADALRRALDKLQVALGGNVSPVAVDLAATDPHLDLLRAAVADRRVVEITYRDGSGHQTTRSVEPWAVTIAGGASYLQGWCQRADAPRDFRSDRIEDVRVTDEEAGPAQVPDLPRYRPDEGDPLVEIVLAAPVAWAVDAMVTESRAPGPDGAVVITLRASTIAWAARLVLSLAPHATATSPPELVTEVAALASQALAAQRTGHPTA